MTEQANTRIAIAGDPVKSEDPYHLDPADAIEPPTTFRGRLKYLGPGLVISAAVVGSGELITTTALGAKAGFILLWLVIISTGIKVWVQLELAQWTILAGKPALEGYSKVGPRIVGRAGWINLLWVLMDFAKVLQRGGIIGGAVACLSLAFPVIGEPLGLPSLIFWTVLSLAVVLSLLLTNKYSVVERLSVVAVVLFTIITVALALALPFTGFAYSAADIAGGLTFALPVGAIGFAIAMFGITGVGADEMTTYTYWCMEKGYARYVGPDDGTPERARRAHGWIRVMRTDVLVSWVISTVCTMSFYVIGAAILHPQNLVPSGNDMIVTLSSMYTSVMGPAGYWIFIVGAFMVLFSTFVASTASVPRLWANTAAILGFYDWADLATRKRIIRVLTIMFPIIWAISYLVIQSPVLMVQIGGIASGIFLVAVVIAVWHLRKQEVAPEFKSNHFFTVMLGVSSFAVAALGIYSALEIFGLGIGA
ncbi:Nramp family divalent metal transporter [Pseudoclavibacter terrae]|uniref:Divalent metal cation transporter n=1 Tax=Pseudoclavibacter terrae TaxID=1530195 RepID=A0A7J5B3V4_9MICO|nr:Nramp family divalent metal transporter [Pseudoclavibacter terrae]KAB1638826.1 divalent metal cation transporter [Pseudoclavibacter terrae]